MADTRAQEVRSYVESNSGRFVEELRRFVRQPSISATGEGVKDCAVLVEEMMNAAGLRTSIFSDGAYTNNPLLLGECGPESAPLTVCLYAHYDICPPTDPSLWTTPPFSPAVREGRIFGGGIADDKAQAFTIIKAAETMNQLGMNSIRLKVLFEGDEEQYSPGLPLFMSSHKDLLWADLLLGADGEAHETGPLVALGLKGTVFVRLEVRTAEKDLPNGYSPVAPNAVWRLMEVLHSIRDIHGAILIDGFYDSIEAITPEEDQWLSQIPYDRDRLLQGLRVKYLMTEDGLDYYRRLYLYPVATIAGIEGGYVGEGVKNVLPRTAWATIDFQIVPNQTCDEIEEKLRRHLSRRGFDDVEMTVLQKLGHHRVPLDHPYVEPVKRGITRACGKAPVMTPCYRGAGGVGHEFVKAGIPVLWIPCLQAMSTNMHGVDENVRVVDVLDGIVAKVLICDELATGA